MNTFDRYYRAVHFLEALGNIPTHTNYMKDRAQPEVYLKRMDYFLGLLDHPERDIRCVHVTGTAGKGTVSSMVQKMLRLSGKRVGLFTSPFVVSSIEKIQVDDAYIPPTVFAEIVEQLKPLIDEAAEHGPYGMPSYFEIFLAIAFIYFKRQRCAWMVLEVGAGGRYDATNIVKHPIVTVITNIDYDHVELLGKTLKKIAYDKAGIIKKGSAFFTSEHRPALRRLFETACNQVGASFHVVSRQTTYQDTNNALVREIGHHLGITDVVIQQALHAKIPPGRFELIQKQPRVILDGAHNRAKIATTVANLSRLRYRRLIVVLGIAYNKDHEAILSQLIPVCDVVYFTRAQMMERLCAHPKELERIAGPYLKKTAKTYLRIDPSMALTEALKLAGKDDLVLVTGSFYLVGELRRRWVSEEWILRARKED